MRIDTPIFLQLGMCMMQRHAVTNSLTSTNRKRFKAIFETSSEIVSWLWALIVDIIGMPEGVCPKHLLWVLLFLKIYFSDSVHCYITGGGDGSVDEKTFQKWSWHFVSLILDLHPNVVSNESLVAYNQ